MLRAPCLRFLTTLLVLVSCNVVRSNPLTHHAFAAKRCAFLTHFALDSENDRVQFQNEARAPRPTQEDIVCPFLPPLAAGAGKHSGGDSFDPLAGISGLSMPGRKIEASDDPDGGGPEDEALKEEARSALEGWISKEPVLVLVTSTCRFCAKALFVLGEEGVAESQRRVVDLNDEDEAPPLLRAAMKSLIGRTSVPAIWIGGEFVGGCNDGGTHGGGLMGLVFEEDGEGDSGGTRLRQMLSDAGALSTPP